MDNNLTENKSPPTPVPLSQPVAQQSVPPLQHSTVVIPEKKENLPFWFYILFTVVAIVFFFISFLLAKTLIDRQNQIVSPTPIPQQTIDLTPTSIITPAQEDQYTESLNSLSDSDELTSIETDVNSTELNQLEEDLQQLDGFVNP